MTKCTDETLGQKLSAYELGLLSGTELQEFESHLFECDSCFEKAEGFKGPSRLIRADPATKQVALDEVPPDGLRDLKTIKISPTHKWWGVSAVAAAVFLVLMLTDWEIQIKPSQEAFAHESLLAIMYFDNMTESGDQSRLGEIITDLLITDLSESEFVSVVSSQRLYDILSLLGHQGIKQVSKDLASQVARRANAKYMLTGSLLQTEPTVIITAQIADVESGNIVASQRVMGNEDDDFFTTVDRLSGEVKIDLSLPEEAYSEDDPSVCDISSCSLDAYRLYLEGVEHEHQGLRRQARRSFAAAIEVDSTFCIAYYYRALVTSGDERNQMIKKALELKSFASKKEQMYISALAFLEEDKDLEAFREYERIIRDYPAEKEAHYRLGLMSSTYSKDREAIEHIRAALEIDPHYKPALRWLAMFQSFAGDMEQSLVTHGKYIELWPDDPQGPSARGTTFLHWGKFDEAIADWRKALRMAPWHDAGVLELGLYSLVWADYDLADSCLKVIEERERGDAPQKFDAAFLRCIVPFRKGQIKRTIQMLKELPGGSGQGEWFNASHYFNQTSKYSVLASIYSSIGKHKKALEILNVGRLVYDSLNPGKQHRSTGKYKHILYLAAAGRMEEASEMAEEFREYMAGDYDHVFYYQSLLATGGIEYIRGNYELALVHFRSAAERPDRVLGGAFLLHYMMAKSHQATGDFLAAIDEYKDVLTRTGTSSHVQYFNHEIDALLGLAASYEEIGDYESAIKHYRRVRDLWRDADKDLKNLYGYNEAMENLARLESQS